MTGGQGGATVAPMARPHSSSRLRWSLVLPCLGACAEPDTFAVTSAWLEPPDRVDGTLTVGAPGFLTVEVANVGTRAGRFTAAIEAPFRLADATYSAAPGDIVPVSVFLTPESPGVMTGLLELRLDADTWEVPVEVEAVDDGA